MPAHQPDPEGPVLIVPGAGVGDDRPRRGALFDPGWLFLIAGVVILSATILLPARQDLAEAEFYRDRVEAVLDHRHQRLARYREYMLALERGDERLIRSLAAMQLNLAPVNQALLVPVGEIAQRSASVFASLEPPPLRLPERVEAPSLLEQWATDQRARLWLIAGGALCVLIGLLPMARER
jgi:hypothetical protein